ncbi:hypothetical protein DFH08DRAFT_862182 [Mycena albidolilacea]|uniref:F-box domain-containing protein n=1 Tax=Mycena albidolilacea TaxID=1033008 RepID=A0AAD7EUD9_9AGAR|nr:hypothetical protein DFH08DRAFT_862182 [Mycena albidolilacea]
MSLHGLPTDIILDIVDLLELPDPISLLLTCSSFYALSKERSFWISILETTRKKSAISCPLNADLSQYTLEKLKAMAFSWLSLQENWNRPFPQIVQPAAPALLPGPAQIIFTVQGTDILVLTENTSVFTWDARLATPFPFPAIETGGHMTQVSGPSEAPGVCSFAISVPQTTDTSISRRYILTIKHAAGKAISIASEFTENPTPPDSHFESLFVAEDMVGLGTIVAMNQKKDCVITLGSGKNCVPDSSVLNIHRSVSGNDLMVSFPYKGHLYILIENGESVQVQHISQRNLCSGRCEESGLYDSEIDSSYIHNVGSAAYCYMVPSTPFYGIAAAFVRLQWTDAFTRITSFTFLPNTATHASDDGVLSPLAFDSPCVSAYLPGELANISLIWLDHSGFNVVAVIQPYGTGLDPLKLVLVRYHPETRSTSSHILTVPDTIDLELVISVCVDDTAGAVYLVDTGGQLWTLRYV